MISKTDNDLVVMVEDPYNWYGISNFDQFDISKKIYKEMVEDPNHLMCINESGENSFLGGYIIGFGLKRKLDLSGSLRKKSKQYKYIDPLKFSQKMEIHPDSLPEKIDIWDKNSRSLLERIQIGENQFYRICLESLAYLSLPVVRRQNPSDLSLYDIVKKYRLSGDDVYRDEFLTRTEELVKIKINKNFLGALVISKDPESLMNAGKVGAERAFNRFDLEAGVKVETYLPFIIKGAIGDYLRTIDKVSRTVRSTVKKIRPIIEEARQYDDPITIDQLVELTNRKRETVEQAYAIVINGNTFRSMEEKQYETDSGREVTLSDTIEDTNSYSNPPRRIDVEDTLSFFLEFLDPRSQEVVVRYNLEGETMKSIGENLGCSESRISQEYNSIMDRLKGIAARMDRD